MFWIFLIVYIVTIMVLYGFFKEEESNLSSKVKELEKQLESKSTKIVEKPIYREVVVEKRVEVPVEKIVYVEKDNTEGAVVCLDDIKQQADDILNTAIDEAEKLLNDAREEYDRLISEANKDTEDAEDKSSVMNWYLDEREERLNEKEKQLNERETLFNENKNFVIESAYRERDIILKDVDLNEFIETTGLVNSLKDYNSFMDAFIDEDKALDKLKELIKENRNKQKKFKAVHKKGSCYVYGSGYNAFLQSGFLKMGTMVLDLLSDSIVKSSTKEGVESSLKKLAKSVSLCENECNVKYYTDYIRLKVEEIKIVCELHAVREKKKEEQRLLKEQQREEAAAQREFERELKKAQKDQQKAEEALKLAREKAEKEKENAEAFAKYQEQIAALQAALEESQQRSERVMSMAQQTRQGWVYIISNIGSFGENVYKIGMTRRLDPMERVNELGDASVPFPFDVHAMIFSEDAPALETELHQAFDSKKTNLINGKKEFFNVSLSEIKEKVKELGYDVDFEETANAPQYRDTLFARNTG